VALGASDGLRFALVRVLVVSVVALGAPARRVDGLRVRLAADQERLERTVLFRPVLAELAPAGVALQARIVVGTGHRDQCEHDETYES